MKILALMAFTGLAVAVFPPLSMPGAEFVIIILLALGGALAVS